MPRFLRLICSRMDCGILSVRFGRRLVKHGLILVLLVRNVASLKNSGTSSLINTGGERWSRERAPDGPAITHTNIRGAGYFH